MIKTLKQMNSFDKRSELSIDIEERNVLEFISKSQRFIYFKEICRKLFEKEILPRSKNSVRTSAQWRRWGYSSKRNMICAFLELDFTGQLLFQSCQKFKIYNFLVPDSESAWAVQKIREFLLPLHRNNSGNKCAA